MCEGCGSDNDSSIGVDESDDEGAICTYDTIRGSNMTAAAAAATQANSSSSNAESAAAAIAAATAASKSSSVERAPLFRSFPQSQPVTFAAEEPSRVRGQGISDSAAILWWEEEEEKMKLSLANGRHGVTSERIHQYCLG